MATSNPNAPEILREEILADARRESEEIIRRARQEAEAFLARAATETAKARQERLEAARAEAVRRAELILATVPVEASRLRSARIEAVLQSVYEEARRRLLVRAGFDYRESVVVLAAEAVSRMAGETFVVKLGAPERAAFGDGLAAEIARRAGRSPLRITLSDDPAMTDGGPMIQDAEGRQVWDNSLPARLERLWPELRRQVAVQTALVGASGPAGGGA